MGWLMKDGNYPYIDGLPDVVSQLIEPYPDIVFKQTTNYPYLNTLPELIQGIIFPYPTSMFCIADDYPYLKLSNIAVNGLLKPYPECVWIIDDSYPFLSKCNYDDIGACCYASNLEELVIPKTVKSIGEFAFTNTSIKEVQLPDECTYFKTSFPEDCEIEQ